MSTSTKTEPKIPVVDFSNEDCWKPGTSCWVSARKQVCQALEEVGCFMAVLSNKVSLELHNTIFDKLEELFDFCTQIKTQDDSGNSKLGSYVTANSAHEALGIEANPEQIQKFTHRFWPNGNNQFCESVDVYAKVMAEVNQLVTKMVFENYGVEKYHDDHVQLTSYNLRFNKYKERKNSGIDLGLTSHTDKTFSTILHQNHVNGLEISTKDDEWIMVDPLPTYFTFLAGDVFQVWSNDRIRPCKHRVSLKDNGVRYSFGLFSLKKGMTEIPKELVDKDHPLRYKPLNHMEYLTARKSTNHETEYAIKAYCGI